MEREDDGAGRVLKSAPSLADEAQEAIKMQHWAITEALKKMGSATVTERAAALESAAFHLQAMGRDLKTLQREGAGAAELHRLRKEAGNLGKAVEKEVKALAQDVKKPGALDGLPKEAAAALVATVQKLGKSIETDRSR